MNHEIVNLNEVIELIFSFAEGNYSKRGEISEKGDKRDSLISGINMLGEELESKTISRDFFESIFHAVQEMIFVLDINGKIRRFNNVCSSILNIPHEQIYDQPIENLLTENEKGKIINSFKIFSSGVSHFSFETHFELSSEKSIIVSCQISKVLDRLGEHEGYLLIVQDISEKKIKDNIVIKTIVETQGKERKKLADNLNSSVNHELNSIKMVLFNLTRNLKENQEFQKLLNECNEQISTSIQTIEEISENLMPKSIDEGGLFAALKALANRLNNQKREFITINFGKEVGRISKKSEIILYQLIEELLNYFLDNDATTKIFGSFEMSDDKLIMELKKTRNSFIIKRESGIHNIGSKIKAFGGTYKYFSTYKNEEFITAEIPISLS